MERARSYELQNNGAIRKVLHDYRGAWVPKSKFMKDHGGWLVRVYNDDMETGDFMLSDADPDLATEYWRAGFELVTVHEGPDGEDFIDPHFYTGYQPYRIGYMVLSANTRMYLTSIFKRQDEKGRMKWTVITGCRFDREDTGGGCEALVYRKEPLVDFMITATQEPDVPGNEDSLVDLGVYDKDGNALGYVFGIRMGQISIPKERSVEE